MHNIPLPRRGKASLFNRVMTEVPIKPIIGFFQVELYEHEVYTSLFYAHRMKNFLVDYFVVNNLATENKATLDSG